MDIGKPASSPVERSPASSPATARKKFYAVAVGRHIGIFDKWAPAKVAVEGVPKAVYRGFATLNEAEKWMRLQMQNRREGISFGTHPHGNRGIQRGMIHTSTGPAVLSMNRDSLMHSGARGQQTPGNTLYQEHVEGHESMKDVSSVVFEHSTPSTEGTILEREEEQGKSTWHECNRGGGLMEM